MRKIFTLCAVLFFAQITTYGQTYSNPLNGLVIDSVVVIPILCDGDPTCATVYTSATGTATYNLEIFTPSPSPGMWLQHPSFPITGPAISTICNLTAGTIRITGEFPISSGIIDTIEIPIAQPDPIANFVTNVTNISCNGANDGSISTVSFLGTPNYTYTLDGGPAVSYAISPHIEIIPNLTPGIHTINIFDANNCAYSGNPITQAITEPTAITVSSSTTNVSCNGGNDGTATVNVSGGTPGYNYLWSPGGQTTATATNLTAGTYTCTVTDVNGCTVSSNATVLQPAAALTVTSTVATNVNCFGGNNGTATVNVSGGTPGYTYLWSPGGQTTNPATGLTAGTYTCTVTDANGCQITSPNISVTQPTALTISLSTTLISCFGGNGTATASVSGGAGGYTYLWNPGGQTTNPATNLTAGTYTCTVTDVNGCTVSSNTTVLQPAAALTITSTTSTNASNCNGGWNNGTATANPSGGTPPYTYFWSNGQTTQTATNLTAGTYTCTVTDANGCSYPGNPISVTISQPTALTITLSTTLISCNGGNNGTATASVSGGTLPYTYSWSTSPIQTTQTATNLIAGTYTCTVTDVNGCIVSLNTPVLQTASALTISGTSSIPPISCFGGSNGTATVTVIGGTPPYTYSWSTSPIQQTTNPATNLTAGTYTCTVTDANGCTDINTVTVHQSPSSIQVVASSTNVSCNGGNNGTATASVSGGVPGYTYAWNTGQTTSSINGLTAGTYICTITDLWSCIHVETIIITEPLPITISFSPIPLSVSCNGGSNAIATANPTGGTPGYTYSWNTSPIQTTQTITNLSIGTYICTVTDVNGCLGTATAIITQPTLITASGNISHVSCNGDSDGWIDLSVSGGNPYTSPSNPYTYLWSNGQTTSMATGLTAGLVTVQVTDANSCSQTYVFTINQPSVALSASLTITDVSCNGDSNGILVANVVGGTLPYNYSWPNGQNSQSFTNLFAGTYTCNITDANGCPTSATAIVSEPSPITIASSSNSASCFGYSDGTLTITPTGGVQPYTYAWSNGQSTPTITGLSANTYTVWVTDANGCVAQSGPLTVNQPNQISANLNITHIICNGDSNGAIMLSGVGGTTPPYSYFWSNGNTGPTNTNLTAGTYYVTITDGLGCNNTLSATITEPTAITANLVYNNISINGANNGAISVNAFGGVPGYTYTWTGTNNYINTGANINNLIMGVYTVTIYDANFCSQSFSQAITQPNCNVNIDSTYIAPACYGQMGALSWLNSGGLPPYTNTLTNSNGTTIPSVNGAQFTSPNTPVQLPVGVWDLVVVDAAGCPGILNIPVTAPDSISVILSLSDATCNNYNDGTASATVTGGTSPYNIDWGGVNPNQLIAGNYNVLITDSNGCISGPTNFTIGQPDQLVVDSIVTTTVSCTPGNDGTATIYSSGGTLPYSYLWSNGQTTQTSQNLIAGTYSVTILDANVCPLTVSLIQIVNAAPLNVNINVTPISCNGGSDGSLTANFISGVLPLSYSWFDLSNPSVVISSDSTINNLSAGAYSLLVIDANGCIDQGNISLTNPYSIGFTLQPTNVSINGANDGTISIVGLSGGTSPYTFYWTGPNGFISISQNLTITNLAPGTYTLTVTDNNGCTTTQSAVINTPGCTVQLNTLVVQPLCFGQTGTLNWTNSGGGGSYTNTLFDLNTNTILYNQNITGSLTLSDGNYSLIITDQYGCSDLANISIQAPAPLVANTTTIPASCFGYSNGSISINATGGTPPYYTNWGTLNGFPLNPNAVPSGVYSALITDDNGCNTLPSPTSYAITEPAPISVTSSSTNVSCNGGNDGFTSVSVTGGEAPYSYLWSPGAQTTPNLNILTAGTYFVTITDFNGCTDTTGPTSISISEPNTAVSFSNPAFNITDPGCFGFSDGTAEALPSGGTPPYAYFWANGQTTQIATGLSAGTYTCTITDANGCSDSESAVLVEPNQIQANITTNSVSCNGASDGSATVYITGGSGTYDIVWFNGTTNTNTINSLAVGTWFVHITDNLNPACHTTPYPSLFNIYEPDIVTVTTSIIQNTSCFGGGNGSVSATVTGGTAPYTYSWDTNPVQTTAQATGLVSGTYVCTVTDDNGCIDSSGVSIGSPSLIVPNITVNSVLCYGGSDGSASVSPTGGTPPYSYLWSGTGSTSASSMGLNATTTYFVSISDANGCPPVIFPVNIPQPNSISTTLTITSNYNGYDISCYGSADAIVDVVNSTGGSGSYTYSKDSIYYVSTTTFTSLPAGIFSLWTKDSNGCLGLDNISIVEPAIIDPNIILINEETCDGDGDGEIAAASSGGTGPPYSYVWNTNLLQTSSSITGLSAGPYTVSVTDANGCIGTESFTLGIAHELITVITTTQVTCTGGSDGSAEVSVSGTGTPSYIYEWTDGSGIVLSTLATTGMILPAGVYSVLVTDQNGCSILDIATIVQSANSLTITNTQVTNLKCNGDNDGSITITAGGGTGPYTYSWNTTPVQTAAQATGLSAGTYTVNITDDANCTISIPIIVTEPSPLSGVFSVGDISCFGVEDGSITTAISGGTTPYIYNWTGPSAFSANTNNIDSLNSGSYTLSVRDFNDCIYTNTIVINNPLPLTYVVATIEPLCFGDANGSIELLVMGGTMPYTANFLSYTATYPAPDEIIFSSLPAGGDSVYVTDANLCTTTSYVNLTEPSLLVIDSHSEVNPTCYGYSNGSATFGGMGGTSPYSYQVLDASGIVVGTSSTTHSLTDGGYDYLITDNNGCSATLSFIITQPAEIIIIKNTINKVDCFGESTGSILVNVQDAVGDYAIFWTGPSGFSSNLDTISDLSEGTYTATVKDDNNCWSNPTSFYVDQNAAVDVNYSTQNASCVMIADGMILVNSFTGGTAPYNVYNNGTLYAQNEYVSTTIDALFTTISGVPYTLLITDANNCEFTTQITLDFDGGYNCINEPIIISPNMDGTNDSWKPILDLNTDIEVSILNRWGQLEYYYSGNSIVFEWDGLSTDGNKLPSMDYYYIIKFNNFNYPDRTGVITLIR